MGLFTIEWAEELDLSGGSAAVALSLAAGRRGPWNAVTGSTDNARSPSGDNCKIKAMWAVNETVCNSGASFTCAELQRGNWELFPINLGTTIVPVQKMFFGDGIPIPSESTLAHLGFDGGGAEQNVGCMLIEDPDMEDPWNLQAPQAWKEVIFVRPTTNARVLNTISGHTDICGRSIAYTDGQTAIPPSSQITIQVISAQSNDVAGYSGMCLESPGKANLMLPCAATMSETWNMMDVLGGLPTCTADKPFNIAGFGVTTATMTLSGLLLGLSY